MGECLEFESGFCVVLVSFAIHLKLFTFGIQVLRGVLGILKF